MKLTINTPCLFFITILGVFVLSSCITNTGNLNETVLSSTMTLLEGTSTPQNESTLNVEKESNITATSTIMVNFKVTTAEEAAETYYVLMGTQKYADAYQLLSKFMPHKNTSDEFITRAATLYKSYELLSIESYPAWSATQYAAGKLKKVSMVVENERCKRFIVEVKIEYKEGQMGAGPSGTYDYALTIIKDDNGWKIVQIDTIPDPYTCERYK